MFYCCELFLSWICKTTSTSTRINFVHSCRMHRRGEWVQSTIHDILKFSLVTKTIFYVPILMLFYLSCQVVKITSKFFWLFWTFFPHVKFWQLYWRSFKQWKKLRFPQTYACLITCHTIPDFSYVKSIHLFEQRKNELCSCFSIFLHIHEQWYSIELKLNYNLLWVRVTISWITRFLFE